MLVCASCGVRLRRVHRTFWERVLYLAAFDCPNCRSMTHQPRAFLFHLGKVARCPLCGDTGVRRLKRPDPVDRVIPGLLNLVKRLAGGSLHHCRNCRIQFYDRRPVSTKPAGAPARVQRVAGMTADSGFGDPPDGYAN